LPLYEYQCGRCGRFEIIRKFSDAPLSACPTCGQEVQKLLSAPAIQFKGTGWYITDYARKSKGGAEGASKDGGKDGGKEAGKATPAADSGGKEKAASDGSSTSSGSGSGDSPSTSTAAKKAGKD
jgi:putative FmdB family regulatory protein